MYYKGINRQWFIFLILFVIEEDWRVLSEGENCGGIAGIQCKDGLECKYEEVFPDGMGTCVKKGRVNDKNKTVNIHVFRIFLFYVTLNIILILLEIVDIRCSEPGKNVPSPYDSCNSCLCLDDGTVGLCTLALCQTRKF